ncbi:MAG: integration host factor subunit alpha [Deltaproteobacteria bacterium RBG_13_61_14]|nr:MAG: integration host factor subunit alpha [Deltaproteobacteria bacterium RBG_13_61_14]
MTKAEIVEQIYEKVGFSRRESSDIVETMLEIMKESLAEGEKIKISGFGNFVVRAKRERVGRNPHTGQEIKISARKVITFKASQILKTAVNRGHAG